MTPDFFQEATLKKIWVETTLKNLRWHPIKIWVDDTPKKSQLAPYKKLARFTFKITQGAH